MKPTISIIVPTYQRSIKLQRALESISSSTSQPKEVIVIDDCPDWTAAKIAMDYNCQYINKGGVNKGLSKSRNIGISIASGEWLSFLDDDDILNPSAIDELLQFATREQLDFAFGNYSVFNDHEEKEVDTTFVSHDHLMVCNQIPVGAYIIKRHSIRNKFSEQMRSHEDWKFLLDNVDWSHAKHLNTQIAKIDKTENTSSSMQANRRKHFWQDFIAVYSAHPGKRFSSLRSKMLSSLGPTIPTEYIE